MALPTSTPSAIGTEPDLRPGLKRSLTLMHTVLYGLGVTIGAGIYVLIGAAAARAGIFAPIAFILAAFLMALTAATLAELGSRMPVAAGEAAYVREAFQSDRLAAAVGLLVIAIAVISAAAISVGSAGYVSVFVQAPRPLLIAGVVLSMAAISAWGIKESVTFAGIMTLIEVGGLIALIVAGALSEADVLPSTIVTAPPEPFPVIGLLSAALLAVFAFIGFEGIVNVAEELHNPRKNLPRAIFITLALTTLLYVLVVWISLRAVAAHDLAVSDAPLALVFERLTGLSPKMMSIIAIVATLNGIIVQIIMASRVLYGLSKQEILPAFLQKVSPVTQTPLAATALTTALVLGLAVSLPLDQLADATSRVTLVLFALMNVALLRIKMRDGDAVAGGFTVPRWVPWGGLLSCLFLLLADLVPILLGAN